MATKRGHDFDDVPVSNTEKLPQVKELVSLLEFSDKFTTLRLVGKLYAYGTHWVNVKKRDGSRTSFPTACLAFDSETGQRDSTKKCPWCEHEREHPQPKDQADRNKFFGSSFSTDYYVNAISRSLQKRIGTTVDTPTKHEAKTGFKQKDSDTQTPFVVIRLTPSLVRSIKGLKELNVHEDENGDSTAFAVTHPKFGRDVAIKYDKDAAGAAKYPLQIGSDAPLKAVEKKFLQWDLSDLVPTREYKDELNEYTRWAEKLGFGAKKKSAKDIDDEDADSGLDDDEDEEDKPVKKAAKPAPKKAASKPKYEEEDEDEDDSEDEDEADEPVKKPVKKAAAKKPAPWSEDDDEDSEEEDEEPAPKKSVKKPATKKKVVEEDEEDEEDEKPVKKPAPKKTVKKVVEEDEEEEEAEEDEEPVVKKPVKKAPAKTSKKPKYEEEDEEDEY